MCCVLCASPYIWKAIVICMIVCLLYITGESFLIVFQSEFLRKALPPKPYITLTTWTDILVGWCIFCCCNSCLQAYVLLLFQNNLFQLVRRRLFFLVLKWLFTYKSILNSFLLLFIFGHLYNSEWHVISSVCLNLFYKATSHCWPPVESEHCLFVN